MTTTPFFEIDERCNENSIFALRLDAEVHPDTMVHIREAWKTAWRLAGRAPPVLMIFDPASRLSTLTGEELREAGLVRLQ